MSKSVTAFRGALLLTVILQNKHCVLCHDFDVILGDSAGLSHASLKLKFLEMSVLQNFPVTSLAHTKKGLLARLPFAAVMDDREVRVL